VISITDGEPLLIAHRGFAGETPENTVRGVEAAAGSGGADWIEIDVSPTAAGDPVVCHDAALPDVAARSEPQPTAASPTRPDSSGRPTPRPSPQPKFSTAARPSRCSRPYSTRSQNTLA
jgi:glycerophosphoryl diester phosphodiesterase